MRFFFGYIGWWIIKTSCYIVIQLNSFLSLFRTRRQDKRITDCYYWKEKQLNTSEAETFDFTKGFLLRKTPEDLIRIVRDKTQLYQPILKCDYYFPVFYVDDVKFELSNFFVEGNEFDELFFKYVNNKLHINSKVLFLDNIVMVSNLIPVNKKIVLKKSHYIIQ